MTSWSQWEGPARGDTDREMILVICTSLSQAMAQFLCPYKIEKKHVLLYYFILTAIIYSTK